VLADNNQSIPMKPASPTTTRSLCRIRGFIVGLWIAWTGCGRVWAAGGDLDPTFNPGAGANNSILTMALQPDGKIIIGGAFTNYDGVARNRIARLNSNGSLDTTFDPGLGADGIVWTTALQSDGKIIIGGEFTHVNGTNRNYSARLNADGSLDTAFLPPLILNVEPTVYATTVQPDGQVIVAGGFGIARWNAADGSNDTPFNTAIGSGPNSSVFAMTLRSDGKIIIGGAFTNYDGTPVVRIARLNSNGTLDSSFDPGVGPNNSVFATAVQPDGKTLIGGAFTQYNQTYVSYLTRANTNGTYDVTFTPIGGPDGLVETMILQPDGKILIGGVFTNYNGIPCSHIARLNSDGTLDTTFNTAVGANLPVQAIAVQKDGKIDIGGEFTSYQGTARVRMARLLPAAGKISFASANFSVGEGAGNATITLTRTGGADGKVAARISLADVTTSPADYLATPGALDTSFNTIGATPGFSANVAQTITVQPDGKVLVGGIYFNYGDIYRQGIARLNFDGSLDTTFDSGAGTTVTVGGNGNAYVVTTALQPDGKILIGGNFNIYDGTDRNYVARLNSDGSLDATFDPGNVASQPVRAIVVQPDGKILVAGDYISYGTDRTFIARLNSDGSLDAGFHPAATYFPSILTLALQPDGKVIIGGEFQDYAGTGRNFIARLNANGSLDTSFDSSAGTNGVISSLVLQPDGKIIATGYVLIRLNPDGFADPSFHPGSGPEDFVRKAILQPDGKIIIVGDFQAYDGVEREFIARVNPNGSLDLSFDPADSTNTGLLTTALTPDGSIFIGGAFIRYRGITRRGIARLVSGDFFASWEAGEAGNKAIHLPIVDDLLVEGNETLALSLAALFGGAEAGAQSTAALTIIDNEGNANIGPVANSQSVAADENGSKVVTLTGSDGNGDLLTFILTTNPVHGTLSGVAPNLIYYPDGDYNGSDNFAFKVNDGQVDSTNQGIVSITVKTSFAQWQQKHFTPQELNDAAISGDAADPDGDGINNLLEYAFALDPKLPSSTANLPKPFLGPTYFSVVYTRAVGAADLTFGLEQSADLTAWSPIVPTNVVLADDGATQTVKAEVPLTGGVHAYLRLTVSR
jgi:uncharacterized delta-60 repeat protein